MLTAAVIPAYNEENNIGGIISQIKNLFDFVVVVDDGSFDRTFSVVESLKGGNVFLLRHRVNLGKGAALRTACRAAVRLGAEIIATIDGDGQHPPQYALEMIRKLENDNLDIVFSVRQGGNKMPLIRRVGNNLINWAVRSFFNLNLRDLWCGLRVIRASILPKINWTSNDYAGEVQMALKVGQNNLHYGEYFIPILYNNRFKGVMIIDGLKVLTLIILWRIRL